MLNSVTLEALKASLVATVKEGKIALLFHFSNEKDPVRGHIIRKIAALEKLIEGIDLVQAGGTAETAKEGLDLVIASIDETLPHVPPPFQETFYAERAHFIEMKDKFQKLDELLDVSCAEENEEILLN